MLGYFFSASYRVTSHCPAKNGHITIARTSSYGLTMPFHIPIHVPPNASPLATGTLESNAYLQWSTAVQTEAYGFCGSLSCEVGESFTGLYSLKVSAIKKKCYR